jgi:hypothetical protein
VPHEKSNRSGGLPHYEKVTQIKMVPTEEGGTNGVKNERKESGHPRDLQTVSGCKPQEKNGYA